MSSLPPLPRSFYARETSLVATELLGKVIVRRRGKSILLGKIVEVEAYGGKDDSASHAYRGKTERNSVMFGDPGLSYVYFTYGNHYCLNAVAKDSAAGAVLIRALEPLEGIDLMMRNRGTGEIIKLASGPGKLTQALAITKKENGIDMTNGGALFISAINHESPLISVSTRIGISSAVERPWRFFVADSRFVSRMRS